MIVRNTIIYAVGNALPKVIGFLLIPLYSRILSPDDYGIIGGIGSLGAILSIAMTLALDRSIFRLYWEFQTDKDKKEYLGTIIIGLTVVSVVSSMLLIFPIRPLLHKAYPDIPFFPYYTYSILTVAIHTVGLVPKVWLQINKKATLFVSISATETLLNTLTIVVFVAILKRGVVGFFEAQLLSALVFMPVYGFMSNRISIFRFKWKSFVESTKFSLPMIPNLISAWVMHSTNRLILIRYTSQADVGLFSLAGQLTTPITMLSSAFLSAYHPFFYELANKKTDTAKAFLKQHNNGFICLLATVCALAVLVVQIAFDWIFDARYGYVKTFLPAMIVSVLISLIGGLTHMSIYQHKRSDVVMYIQLIVAAVQLGLNFLLIPTYHIAGAIYAALISETIGTIIRYSVSKRFYFIPYSPITLIFSSAVVLTGVIPLITSSNMMLYFASLSILASALFYFIVSGGISNIKRIVHSDKCHSDS